MVKLVYTVILVIALMGVEIGTKLAYGTNEASYKLGYNLGVSEYSICESPNSGGFDEACTTPPSHIDRPGSDCAVNGMLTKTTACIDWL
jgi:hypothetical protein